MAEKENENRICENCRFAQQHYIVNHSGYFTNCTALWIADITKLRKSNSKRITKKTALVNIGNRSNCNSRNMTRTLKIC